MTPKPLHLHHIAIKFNADDYAKVKGLLPIPSCHYSLQGYKPKIILVYSIEGHITTPSQYRWISNIKLGLANYLCVPFEYEEDYIANTLAHINNVIYTIKELSTAFNAPLIIYPKIMYPSTQKELYRHLCWYGKRLIHQRVFTKEALTATALLMNSKLKDKYSNRDIHKKVLGVCMWIGENIEGFSVGLDEVQLKKAHSKGARTKNQNQALKTKERIQKLLKTGEFTKPNGKVNLSLLAKAMSMNRKTVAKYIEG